MQIKKNIKNELSILGWIFTKNEGYLNIRCDINRFNEKNYIIDDYIRKKCRGQYNLLICVSSYIQKGVCLFDTMQQKIIIYICILIFYLS